MISLATLAIADTYLTNVQAFSYTGCIIYSIILANSHSQLHFKPIPILSWDLI